MEIVKLKIQDLELNSGQIDGLPVNPREWTQSDIDSLARSLNETPELFEARPIIVVPHEKKYVILGGNLRYEASRHNKAKEVPCIILPEDTPVEKLKEIVIKDNGTWGKWSYDALANEWDDLPLADWGVPAWSKPEEGVDIDGLFDSNKEATKKANTHTEVTVCIPWTMEEQEEEIRAALTETIEKFPGVYIKE